MDQNRLVVGLAAVFAGCTVTMTVLAFTQSLFLLLVAVPFGLATYFMWYHATGRLEARTRQRARRASRAGDAARGANASSSRLGEQARQRARAGGTQSDGGRPTAGIDRREAAETLGVALDASEETIQQAYRERVKEVHPDSGGDEAAFKAVNDAYERLSE